jgi:lysophospholipase L1-like esterase
MKRHISCAVTLLSLALSACSSEGANGANGGGGKGSGGKGAATAGTSTGGTSSSEAGTPPTTPPGSTPAAMPLVSGDAPAFASSSEANGMPDGAKDRKPETRWASTAVPAWLAYDLSGVPTEQRQQVLIAWYGGGAVDFINTTPDAGKRLPIDYTLEINDAPGGTPPPTDGWNVVATVTGNDRNARQRLVALGGANWVRMNVTKSTAPNSVGIDLDIHDAPDGATDSWLFMGDSITFLSTSYPFSNLPALVNGLRSDRFPAIIPAAIGGTNTTTALAAIDDTMADYPGRFVVLAYGTNDHVNEYKMEDLVKKVIAAGKAPAIPHMPWSSTAGIQESGPQINQIIDDLYVKYPEILHGPDLWQLLTDRLDLIPAGEIHPNGDGQEALREAWAKAMTR